MHVFIILYRFGNAFLLLMLGSAHSSRTVDDLRSCFPACAFVLLLFSFFLNHVFFFVFFFFDFFVTSCTYVNGNFDHVFLIFITLHTYLFVFFRVVILDYPAFGVRMQIFIHTFNGQYDYSCVRLLVKLFSVFSLSLCH